MSYTSFTKDGIQVFPDKILQLFYLLRPCSKGQIVGIQENSIIQFILRKTETILRKISVQISKLGQSRRSQNPSLAFCDSLSSSCSVQSTHGREYYAYKNNISL